MSGSNGGPLDSERLDGWKSIAAHFGRSVRTVQVWEKDFALPVHRLQGRVWSTVPELTAWEQTHQELAGAAESEPATDVSPPPASQPASPEPADAPPSEKPRPRTWLVTGAIIAAMACTASWAWVATHRTNPVQLNLNGGVLHALDIEGKEVWRYTLPGIPEPYVVAQDHPRDYPRSLFADLNGDGRNELLYIYWPKGKTTSNGTVLYCFSSEGSLLWTHKAGRPLTDRTGKEISGVYVSSMLGVLDRARSDGGRIVVGSQHVYTWPYQVAILTAQGKQTAEYFHPGWLLKLAIADLDGDGFEELLLGGVSGSYNRSAEGDYGPTLVVLDSRHVRGQGRTRPEEGPALRGLETGAEKAVLFFPGPVAHPSEYFRVHRLRVNESDVELEVRLTTEPTDSPFVIYRLDRKLKVRDVIPNNILEGMIAKQPAAAARLAKERLQRVLDLTNEFR